MTDHSISEKIEYNVHKKELSQQEMDVSFL